MDFECGITRLAPKPRSVNFGRISCLGGSGSQHFFGSDRVALAKLLRYLLEVRQRLLKVFDNFSRQHIRRRQTVDVFKLVVF